MCCANKRAKIFHPGVGSTFFSLLLTNTIISSKAGEQVAQSEQGRGISKDY